MEIKFLQIWTRLLSLFFQKVIWRRGCNSSNTCVEARVVLRLSSATCKRALSMTSRTKALISTTY